MIMTKKYNIKDKQDISAIISACLDAGYVSASMLARRIAQAGYRKVPDGAVILSPEERDEELKACNERQAELEAEIAREKANYYNKGVIDGREDFELIKQRNKRLYEEIECLAADNETLKMWNNCSAETIQKLSETNKRFESNMKSVLEIEKKNAVKEFAQKLKEKFGDYEVWHYDSENEAWHDLQSEIDECVKEYENADN